MTELCRFDKVYYLHNLLPLAYKVWDKVIFSQACLSMGAGDRRAVPISSMGGGGLNQGRPPSPANLGERAVRILVEYIYVIGQ